MSCSNRCGAWEPLCCDFPGGSGSKESACSAGDLSSTPGSGRCPGEGNGNPFQYSGLENPMDRGALAGCSPWGRKRVGYNWATNTHSLILCKEPCSERPYEAGPSVTHLKPMVETWSCESHLQRACRPRDRESDFITDWVSEPSSPVSPSVNWGIGLNNLSMSCQQL